MFFRFNCFSSPERASLWCCLMDWIVSVPQRGRGCGIAWVELFQFPGEGAVVGLLGLNCFSSLEMARLWDCLV